MLSRTTISTVRATIPLLEAKGEALTARFYERLFKNAPEVVPFFNPANQASGRQHKALAGAIIAYARNIEDPAALSAKVELISQKHASLMVKAEHYPIVGANLLDAIRDVLGAEATEGIIAAWADAYGFLAEILSGREAEIVSANASRPGGWAGFRPFMLASKERESSVITSFYLEPEDGALLPRFEPGQYVTVRRPTASGSTTMRNYTLSDAPNDRAFRISVKREEGADDMRPDGMVSTELHHGVEVGDTIEVGPPCGDFTLDGEGASPAGVLFLAGGVGITPLLSMAKGEVASGRTRPVVFVHACLDRGVQAFRRELNDLAAEAPRFDVRHRYSDLVPTEVQGPNESGGLVDLALLEAHCESLEAWDVYVCGPEGFMAGMKALLSQAGVPAAKVRSELFGPE